jgi:MORN repeat
MCQVVYKSGASYVGDFYSGMYHGRGVYTSCPTTPFNNTNNNKQLQSVVDTTTSTTTSDTTDTAAITSVVYDGRWEHGYIGGYGTLTVPGIGAGESLQRYKRDWPSVSRYVYNSTLLLFINTALHIVYVIVLSNNQLDLRVAVASTVHTKYFILMCTVYHQ